MESFIAALFVLLVARNTFDAGVADQCLEDILVVAMVMMVIQARNTGHAVETLRRNLTVVCNCVMS